MRWDLQQDSYSGGSGDGARGLCSGWVSGSVCGSGFQRSYICKLCRKAFDKGQIRIGLVRRLRRRCVGCEREGRPRLVGRAGSGLLGDSVPVDVDNDEPVRMKTRLDVTLAVMQPGVPSHSCGC